MRLLYSVRTSEDVIYSDELGDDAVLTFTREPPDGGRGTRGGSTPLIAEAAYGAGIAFVCGTNGFVEAATMLLMDAGLEAGDSHRALRADRLKQPTPASQAVDVSISGLPFVLGVNSRIEPQDLGATR